MPKMCLGAQNGFLLRKAEFAEIKPIWTEKLWPGRKSTIRPVSPINHAFQYDPAILNSRPEFWVLTNHSNRNEIIGTVSGYTTSSSHYRSRGLYVSPEYRGRGLSKLLLRAPLQSAKNKKAAVLWTFPRLSAWPVYEKFGFIRRSEWTEEGMEFGPNCLACLELLPDA